MGKRKGKGKRKQNKERVVIRFGGIDISFHQPTRETISYTPSVSALAAQLEPLLWLSALAWLIAFVV